MSDSDNVLKKVELDKCRKELALLQSRFKVGEIGSDVFDSESKILLNRISLLEKEVNKIPLSVSDRLKKHRALIVIVAAAVLGLLLCAAVILLVPRQGTGIGNIAPDFVMQLADDNTTALSSFRDKNVVLVFWDRDFWDDHFFSVNGVTRKLYTPDKLNELLKKYPAGDLAVIAIASGADSGEIDDLVKEYDIAFPVISDTSGKLRSSYNISYEPTSIFLDKKGIIRARVEGPITSISDYEQIIHAAGSGDTVNAPQTPIINVLVQSNNEKSAMVTWGTAVPTTTQVDIDGKNIQTVITPAPVTLHSLSINDLSPNTPYQIRILYNVNYINVSEHSYSALADTIVSKRYLATTSGTDSSYPEISGAGTSSITDSSILVTWKTDEPSSGEVDFGIGNDILGTASQGNSLSIWHTVKLDGLIPDTEYRLKLRSKDTGGKESTQELPPVKTLSIIETAPLVGKRAPDFTLKSIDGIEYSVSQFLGRKVMLNFWLDGCLACELEMPLIQTAFDKYGRDQLAVLAVNVRGDPDKVKYYVANERLSFPVLIDSEGNVDAMYKSPAFPTTFMIDSTGVIREIKSERFQTLSEIDDALAKLDCCK
ncbi:MAG: redoxin domain-containing protein [Dehalococcoidia bacterium]|nr:redoxin domain-containing protein [Dehalococcoidia bacterium]